MVKIEVYEWRCDNLSEEILEFDWYIREDDKWKKESVNAPYNEDAWSKICENIVKRVFLSDSSIGLICLHDTSKASKQSIQFFIENETRKLSEYSKTPLLIHYNKRTKGDCLEQGGCYIIFDSFSYDKDDLHKRILDSLNFVLNNEEFNDDAFILLSEVYSSSSDKLEFEEKYQKLLNEKINGLLEELKKEKGLSDIRIYCWITLLNCNDDFVNSIVKGDLIIPMQVKVIGIPRCIPGFSSTRSSNQEKLVENLSENKTDKNSDIVKESGASINKEQNHFSEETYNVKYMNKGDR